MSNIDNGPAIQQAEIEIKKATFNLQLLLNDDGGSVMLRPNDSIHIEVLPDSTIEVKIPCKGQLIPAKFKVTYDLDPV